MRVHSHHLHSAQEHLTQQVWIVWTVWATCVMPKHGMLRWLWHCWKRGTSAQHWLQSSHCIIIKSWVWLCCIWTKKFQIISHKFSSVAVIFSQCYDVGTSNNLAQQYECGEAGVWGGKAIILRHGAKHKAECMCSWGKKYLDGHFWTVSSQACCLKSVHVLEK